MSCIEEGISVGEQGWSSREGDRDLECSRERSGHALCPVGSLKEGTMSVSDKTKVKSRPIASTKALSNHTVQGE